MPARKISWSSAVVCALAILQLPTQARAAPFAETGDSQLRSDIEILAAAGVIDDVTTQWPFPWGGILYRLDLPEALAGQPQYVADAAKRVRARGKTETQTGQLRTSIDL